MKRAVGYSDLNIPIGAQCEAVTRAAIKLGFMTLAINTPFIVTNNGHISGNNKGGRKRKSGIDPTPVSTAESAAHGLPEPPRLAWIKQIVADHPRVRILQRITLIFSNIQQLQEALAQPKTKMFDIIAILPTNNEALLASLTSSQIFDIISFDYAGPHWIQKLKFNRQKGDLAAGKEVCFELIYASAKHGDVALENLLYTANTLIEDICVRRTKNIILTSGARNPLEVVSPFDMTSIGFLMSLDEGTTRVACREVAERIIQKTDGRKFGKTSCVFIPASPSEPKQLRLKESVSDLIQESSKSSVN